jgi:hypothetical protein
MVVELPRDLGARTVLGELPRDHPGRCRRRPAGGHRLHAGASSGTMCPGRADLGPPGRHRRHGGASWRTISAAGTVLGLQAVTGAAMVELPRDLRRPGPRGRQAVTGRPGMSH